MRKVVAWVSMFALITGAGAVNNPNLKPSFADLTWYSNRQAVKAQMQSKGYKFIREIPGSGAIDAEYSGKIQGIPAKILHLFNSKNQLVKTVIVFERSYSSNTYSNWNNLASSLNSKYGKGVNLSDVDKMYTRDDISLEYELQSGKKLLNAWSFKTYNYFIALDVETVYVNDDNYYLTLAYESPAWVSELKRRDVDGDL